MRIMGGERAEERLVLLNFINLILQVSTYGGLNVLNSII